jgi:hypothetical protein
MSTKNKFLDPEEFILSVLQLLVGWMFLLGYNTKKSLLIALDIASIKKDLFCMLGV